MEFVIWGAGNRGTDVINVLKDRVVAFIDNDVNSIGKAKRDVPIISYEDYKKKYKECVIIVTPDGYENEIAKQLEKDDIYHYFTYGDGFSNVETYALQVDKKRLFCNLDVERIQYIYGLTLLSLLMYEDLQNNGLKCKIVLRKADVIKYEKFFQRKNIEIAELSNADGLCLSVEPQENLSDYKTIPYFDLISQDIFEQEYLTKFKNKYKGKRCFIIGTGPSLRIEDLETLKENNEICISMNGIYKAFGKTDWRPDIYMVADLDAVYYGKDMIINMDVPYKFVADIAWEHSFDNSGIYKWHLVRRWERGVRPRFSSDFSRCSYAGLTITYDGALQLAAYMGFLEIYLLGIDCSNYRDAGTAHFFDKFGLENKVETGKLNVDDNILAYMSAESYSRANGFRVYNATRGGKLEVFERKDFDSLF